MKGETVLQCAECGSTYMTQDMTVVRPQNVTVALDCTRCGHANYVSLAAHRGQIIMETYTHPTAPRARRSNGEPLPY
jgi:ribosomal protein L33